MLEHLAWIAREVGVAGETADPWAVAGNNSATAAVDALKAFRWVTIVDEVILALTVLGSLAILGSMFLLEFQGRPATTRTRIVQSLVLSDLILGLVGIIGTSIVLGGTPLQAGSTNCSGLGFCLTVVLWTEHLWTLILAIATYMILIYPLHPATLWLERRWYYLWILVWVLAVVIGIIGYTLFGFYPNGGICYYGVNSGLYGELIQFLPRACVMLIISILYARLFVFLRRPDRIRASFSDSSNNASEHVSRGHCRRSRHLFRSSALNDMIQRGRKGFQEANGSDKAALRPLDEKGVHLDSPAAPDRKGDGSRSRSHSGTRDLDLPSGANTPGAFRVRTPPSTPDEPAPWEQVQLPIFHVDGERFGGREAGGGGGGLHRENSSIWSGWKGLGKQGGDRERISRRSRPSTSSSASPPIPGRSRVDSSSSQAAEYPASPKSAAVISVFPPTVEVDLDTPPLERDFDADRTPTQAMYQAGDVWQDSVDHHGTRQGSMSSSLGGRVERFRKPSAISAFSYHVSEAPDTSTIHSEPGSQRSRRSSAYPDPHAQDFAAMGTEKQQLGQGQKEKKAQEDVVEELDEEEGQGDVFDLMRMLESSAPPGAISRPYQEGEHVELVEESMASYLNRKTALLMLWFPLGYVLLFSVSLIRIIYDFAGSPPIELRALSRWFIFSQGILDALIYGLVEWHTKRVVRRRVRKGTFNTPIASRQGAGSGIGGAMRAMGQGSRNLFPSRGGSVQAGVNGLTSGGSIPATDRHMARLNGQSMSRSSNWTPTTSYIPPISEGLIIEEQQEDEVVGTEKSRRAGSVSGSGSGFDLEEDSTRKGSGGSDEVKEEPVSASLEEDARARERRKGD